MKAKSIIYLFICLNAAAYIIGALCAAGVLVGIDQINPEAQNDPRAIAETHFSLLNFSAESIIAGVVGFGIIGLIGWVTKQGVYALYAASIWIIGIFLNIFQFVLTGLSAIMGVLLPPEVAFMSGVIYGLVVIGFFYALAGVITQRPDFG